MHLPPVSSSNWKPPSLFCCCCISFYWWWKFHHIPQTSVWLQTFWWFSTSGFVEKDGDVEAGGLWVCYRAESQTLQPIRTCEDDPQVSAVRKIPYSLRLWNHYSVRAEHVKRMCLGWESFPLPVLVSSLISIRKLQKSLRNSCSDPARSLKSKSSYFNQSTIKPLN